jgi:sulfonate transport system substrate-binding protein
LLGALCVGSVRPDSKKQRCRYIKRNRKDHEVVVKIVREQRRLVRYFGAGLGAVGLTALLGTTLLPSVASAKGPDLSGVTLIIGGQNGGTGPIAQASGAYKNTPYKIEWTNESTSTGEMSALESGAINLGGGGDLSLIFLQANQVPTWTKSNIPLTLVGFQEALPQVAKKYPPFEVLVRKGSGITSLADLKGKKIAYAPGGDLNKFFLKVLVAGGLKTTDVQQVQLATPLGAAALENGQVDAALVNYYYAPGPLAAGAKVIATSNDKDIYTALAGTTFAPTKDLKDPAILAAIKDYLTRTVKYNEWTRTHTAAVAAAYVKYLNLDPDTAKLEAESNVSQLVPVTKQLIASEQSDADLLYKNGVLAHPVQVSIGFTTQFNGIINQALAGLKSNASSS